MVSRTKQSLGLTLETLRKIMRRKETGTFHERGKTHIKIKEDRGLSRD
jgi:hypothetical protein